MNICVTWCDGSVSVIETTALLSDNGNGAALSCDDLDISDPEGRGVTVSRRFLTFDGADWRTSMEPAVLITPAQAADVFRVDVDGKLRLQRARRESTPDGPVWTPDIDGDLVLGQPWDD